MKVWVVQDEKYGAQAVFASEQLANDALANDRRDNLCPSGVSVVVIEFEVQDR